MPRAVFGGRLMFYGADKHKPIQVDGTLIVYAWNDEKGNMERAPDRKYVFPLEDFQKHYSMSRLGHSYSFWLPCDVAGGPLQKMSLIARFIGKDGTELTSTPAHVVLPAPVSHHRSMMKSSVSPEIRYTQIDVVGDPANQLRRIRGRTRRRDVR